MSNSELIKSMPLNEMCLTLANRLIHYYLLPMSEVTCIDNIDVNLIVLLFETITSSSVPDLLECEHKEEEAHNIQAVIDTLSFDILGISLSHITGEAIVAGDSVAIYNLLQILEGIMLCSSTASRVVKRKVKKSHCASFKENLLPKRNGTSSSSLEDIYTSNISSKTKSVPAKLKVKPTLMRNKLKIKVTSKPYRKFSSTSSYKESSNFSPVSNFEVHSVTKSSEKQPSLVMNSPSYKNAKKDNLVEDAFPAVLEKSVITEKGPSQADHFESDQNYYLSSYKPFLKKRKISKLPVQSKTKYLVSEKKIEKLYEENFESKIKALFQTNSLCQTRSSEMRRNHLQLMKKPLKKPPMSPCRKSYLLPYALRRKSTSRISRQIHSQRQPGTKNHLSAKIPVPAIEKSSKGFIQELLEEFPGIQLSHTLMNHIKVKYEQQLFKMHRQVKDCLLKKSKTDLEAENVAKCQLATSNLLKKNLRNQDYLKEIQERKQCENKIKYRLRDSRLKSAKMKKYCSEFQDEIRKKMQKQNIADELVFERVFKETMNIQERHVDYLCQQVKETGNEDAEQYLNYLASLENLYQTQFALLSETIAAEKKDAQIKVKAEKLELKKMQRDFQDVLKREIRFMQKTIIELMEDNHFRELDAEQCIGEMRKRY